LFHDRRITRHFRHLAQELRCQLAGCILIRRFGHCRERARTHGSWLVDGGRGQIGRRLRIRSDFQLTTGLGFDFARQRLPSPVDQDNFPATGRWIT